MTIYLDSPNLLSTPFLVLSHPSRVVYDYKYFLLAVLTLFAFLSMRLLIYDFIELFYSVFSLYNSHRFFSSPYLVDSEQSPGPALSGSPSAGGARVSVLPAARIRSG